MSAVPAEKEVRFDTIEAAIDAIKRGEMVVVVDDDDRENEGDLIVSATKVTPEQMGFIVRHTCGKNYNVIFSCKTFILQVIHNPVD